MCLTNVLEILHNVLLRKQVDLTVYLIRFKTESFDKKEYALAEKEKKISLFFIAITWIKIRMFATLDLKEDSCLWNRRGKRKKEKETERVLLPRVKTREEIRGAHRD